MDLFFLIPLVTGISTSYFTKYVSDEVSYLMGSLTFFSLMLSLILAPWEIKMIVLAIAIISSHRFLRQVRNDKEEKIVASKDASAQIKQQMTRTVEEEKIGTYRGTPYKITSPKRHSQPHPKYELKYRGVRVKNHQTQAAQDSNSDT